MSNFIDEVEVDFTSGTGGSGAVGFHREKHVPRGGPNGSDGGKGGDIILIAEQHKRTLYDFKLSSKFRADNGVHAILNKRGKDGASIELKVPVGTVVYDVETGEKLVDLNIHGMKFIICKGGRGGHGNLHYVSSVRQVPNFAEKGEPGESRKVRMELKLLADIGLVGLPNAGKSTLLSRISAAKPKIADYPFTTITPNLGVVSIADQTFVVADLPGLIEGASEGIGLGHRFLKHAERTKILVHVVDINPIDETDPITNFHLIENELKQYQQELFDRPRIIVLNKTDLVSAEELEDIKSKFADFGFPVYAVSAAVGTNIDPLLFAMLEQVEKAEDEAPLEVNLVVKPKVVEDEIHVVKAQEGGWEIISKKVNRMVAMTELTNRDAVRYLHRRLARMGVIESLRKAGAEEGDTVYVGSAVFQFTDQA